MATLDISYDGRDYTLDLEDLDMDQARAMERFGVPNIKALEEGIGDGDLSALTVAYWLMLQQNGEPGTRLERVRFKPIKFIKAIGIAAEKLAEAKKAEGDAEADPKEA